MVDGIQYQRGSPPKEDYSPGGVLGSVKRGKLDDVVRLLTDFQLPVESYKELDMFYVLVPDGFEQQWIEALRAQPNITGAFLNGVTTLDSE